VQRRTVLAVLFRARLICVGSARVRQIWLGACRNLGFSFRADRNGIYSKTPRTEPIGCRDSFRVVLGYRFASASIQKETTVEDWRNRSIFNRLWICRMNFAHASVHSANCEGVGLERLFALAFEDHTSDPRRHGDRQFKSGRQSFYGEHKYGHAVFCLISDLIEPTMPRTRSPVRLSTPIATPKRRRPKPLRSTQNTSRFGLANADENVGIGRNFQPSLNSLCRQAAL